MMINLSDYYICVSPKNKEVTGNIAKLPGSWKNISGFNLLSDEELLDLSWANYEDVGYINVLSEKLDEYHFDDNRFNNNKNQLKALISINNDESNSNDIISINEKDVIVNEQTIPYIILKKLLFLDNCNLSEVYIECCNGYEKFVKSEVDDLCAIINSNQTKLISNENDLCEKIDLCKCFKDIIELLK